MRTSNTCLAALKTKEGKLIFAGDRRCSWGWNRAQVTVRPKVTKRGGMLFAGTGSAYICDLIGELLQVPKVPKKVKPFEFIHNKIIPAVRKMLAEKKMLNKDGTGIIEKEMHSVILLGLKGEMFELSIDSGCIAVDPVATPTANGCGGQLALGSLLTTEGQGNTLEECKKRLKRALEVAASVSPGCDANVDFVVED